MSSSYVVEREFVVMNDVELSRSFGARHKAKDPKVPTLRVRRPEGGTELLYLFKPPDGHRRLRITTSVGEAQGEQMLCPDAHLYQSQAAEWMGALGKSRMEESNLDSIMVPQAWSSISTVDEYQVQPGRNRNNDVCLFKIYLVWGKALYTC